MNEQRASLISAICAAPDEDSPRLVYADYLLESADALERQHGELIIAQCAVERQPRGNDAWKRARAAEKRLLPIVSSVSLAPYGTFSEWRRGFPSNLAIGMDWLTYDAAAIAKRPLEKLTIARESSTEHGESVDSVTIGRLARVRRAFPHVRTIELGIGDASLELRPSLLPPLDETSNEDVWCASEAPHRDLHAAIVQLDLRPWHAQSVTPYLDLALPALEELSFENAASALAVEMLAKHEVRRLTCAGPYAITVGPALARSGALTTLERFRAEIELDPDVIAAIRASSITDLLLYYVGRDDLLAQLATAIGPRVRRLVLGFRGPYEGRNLHASVRALGGVRFEALETLMLDHFRLDEATSRLDAPKLCELELIDAKLEAPAIEVLRARGLIE